jgi:isopenicillin-N epimerase
MYSFLLESKRKSNLKISTQCLLLDKSFHMENFEHLIDQFYIRKDLTFLNFGSFGACPKPIFEDYQRWQMELEQEPVQFITVTGLEYLKKSREALGKFLTCEADDLVFTVNPSYAMNTVAKSLNLQAGEEILATDIEYGACDKTWDFICEETGAKYVRQKIQLPLTSKSQFIEDFFAGLTSKTKMVFISQITSSTGLILPVKEICEIAKSKGLLTFVDGAHVPAQIDLNLSELKADFYIGACHKWMMTPKGCSFLYATKEAQKLLKPLVVSWGYKSIFPSESTFLDHHQMTGTRDFSAFLTVPKAIEFLEKNDWKSVRKACHQLGLINVKRFCELLNSNPLAPLTNEFYGQLFSIPIQTKEPEKLQKLLFNKYKIEIPVMRQDESVYLRYSIQVFNSQSDLDKLFEALSEIKNETDLIA